MKRPSSPKTTSLRTSSHPRQCYTQKHTSTTTIFIFGFQRDLPTTPSAKATSHSCFYLSLRSTQPTPHPETKLAAADLSLIRLETSHPAPHIHDLSSPRTAAVKLDTIFPNFSPGLNLVNNLSAAYCPKPCNLGHLQKFRGDIRPPISPLQRRHLYCTLRADSTCPADCKAISFRRRIGPLDTSTSWHLLVPFVRQ